MDDARLVTISKYLSKHLRHKPERLGLTLAEGGWVPVDDLLTACAKHQFAVTRAELDEVVQRNDKQRFSFDPTGELIRANQGHSVEVDLQLEPVEPPEFLFHGTGDQSVEAILRDGLDKMRRHHVHLSVDRETARKVGRRHGHPAIFRVDAQQMHADGHVFYCSANGVWLVEHVPPHYLQRL
jgi:putative RNA 2'-phosphotransferase